MLSRVFYYIAGIDREILSKCPATDKLWAAHLGFSLILAFIVVFGISFHATGYVISEMPMRVLVSGIVALTVFMFDRAIYQSDWFSQGLLVVGNREQGIDRRRALRVFVRLTISIALAFILSVFLELAVFSDTISGKIRQDYLASNKKSFEEITAFAGRLDSEIEAQQKKLNDLEAAYAREMNGEITLDSNARTQYERLETEKRENNKKIEDLREQVSHWEKQSFLLQQDMNAEELGLTVRNYNSGQPRKGPRYEWARREKELVDQQMTAKKREISDIESKSRQILESQQSLINAAALQKEQNRISASQMRKELQTRIQDEKNGLSGLQASRNTKLEAFTSSTINSPSFQKLKDDPLARMTAYQELKSDPKDGSTIILFSVMTKLFVIFLEIVPVLAKIFFSPPSVYAAKIRSLIEQETELAYLNKQQDIYQHKTEGLKRERDLDEERARLDEAQRKRERAAIIEREVVKDFRSAAAE